MHFHILGLGSIGTLLAHNLRRALPVTHKISLIHKMRQERSKLRDKPLTVFREGKATTSSGYSHEAFDWDTNQSKPLRQSDSTPDSSGAIDSLIIALKAQQTLKAVEHLAPRLSPHSTIVLLQNGMGVYEEIIDRVFRNPQSCPHFILASNTHGAFITEPFTTVHAGVGAIDFSIVPDPRGRDFEAGLHDESIAESERRLRLSDVSGIQDEELSHYRSLRDTTAAMLLLKSLNVTWRPYSDMQILMRRKLAVNAVVNPLTALLNCPNGELLEHRTFSDILQDVCDEASAVFSAQLRHETKMWAEEMRSQGHDVGDVPEPDIPDSLTSISLQNEVKRVIDITRGNISSTLQDIRRGRSTEVTHLNGYLMDVGKTHGVPTPVNTTLYNLVKLRTYMPVDRIL